MIEKMKFVSISGPKNDLDRMVNQYLSHYEIQLENALSELKTVANLRPYLEINPYKIRIKIRTISRNQSIPGTASESAETSRFLSRRKTAGDFHRNNARGERHHTCK